MAYTGDKSIKGPAGDAGLAGLGYVDADLGGSGNRHLVITDSRAATHDVGEVVGAPGLDGADADFKGTVADTAALTALTASAGEGDAYLLESDGHLHRFDGTRFVDVGSLRGPRGDAAPNGEPGIRGVSWFSGYGPPTGTSDFIDGDRYLDLLSGQIYTYAAPVTYGDGTRLADIYFWPDAMGVNFARLGPQRYPYDGTDTTYRWRSATALGDLPDATWVDSGFGGMLYGSVPTNSPAEPVYIQVEATRGGQVYLLDPVHMASQSEDGVHAEALGIRYDPIADGLQVTPTSGFGDAVAVQAILFGGGKYLIWTDKGANYPGTYTGMGEGYPGTLQMSIASPHGTRAITGVSFTSGTGGSGGVYREGQLSFSDTGLDANGDGGVLAVGFAGFGVNDGSRTFEYAFSPDQTDDMAGVPYRPVPGNGRLPAEITQDSFGHPFVLGQYGTLRLRVTETSDGYTYETGLLQVAASGNPDNAPAPVPAIALSASASAITVARTDSVSYPKSITTVRERGADTVRSYYSGSSTFDFPVAFSGLKPSTTYDVAVTYYASGQHSRWTGSATTAAS